VLSLTAGGLLSQVKLILGFCFIMIRLLQNGEIAGQNDASSRVTAWLESVVLICFAAIYHGLNLLSTFPGEVHYDFLHYDIQIDL